MVSDAEQLPLFALPDRISNSRARSTGSSRSETTGPTPTKYYKDDPETKQQYNLMRRTVVCADGVKRRVYPSHPDYPGNGQMTIAEVHARHWSEIEAVHNYRTGVAEGFVYIVTNPAWPGWVKIGSAIDPIDRSRSYNTGSPYRDYELKAYAYSDNRRELEAAIHDGASDVRGQGEWFDMTAEEAISFISTYAEVHRYDQNAAD